MHFYHKGTITKLPGQAITCSKLLGKVENVLKSQMWHEDQNLKGKIEKHSGSKNLRQTYRFRPNFPHSGS